MWSVSRGGPAPPPPPQYVPEALRNNMLGATKSLAARQREIMRPPQPSTRAREHAQRRAWSWTPRATRLLGLRAALLLSIVHPSRERADTFARAEGGEQVAERWTLVAQELCLGCPHYKVGHIAVKLRATLCSRRYTSRFEMRTTAPKAFSKSTPSRGRVSSTERGRGCQFLSQFVAFRPSKGSGNCCVCCGVEHERKTFCTGI